MRQRIIRRKPGQPPIDMGSSMQEAVQDAQLFTNLSCTLHALRWGSGCRRRARYQAGSACSALKCSASALGWHAGD
jgi:hypothetical protein